jgi:hypothetical protein
MNVVIEEESGHCVILFTQNFDRIDGTIATADMKQNAHNVFLIEV